MPNYSSGEKIWSSISCLTSSRTLALTMPLTLRCPPLGILCPPNDVDSWSHDTLLIPHLIVMYFDGLFFGHSSCRCSLRTGISAFVANKDRPFQRLRMCLFFSLLWAIDVIIRNWFSIDVLIISGTNIYKYFESTKCFCAKNRKIHQIWHEIRVEIVPNIRN